MFIRYAIVSVSKPFQFLGRFFHDLKLKLIALQFVLIVWASSCNVPAKGSPLPAEEPDPNVSELIFRLPEYEAKIENNNQFSCEHWRGNERVFEESSATSVLKLLGNGNQLVEITEPLPLSRQVNGRKFTTRVYACNPRYGFSLRGFDQLWSVNNIGGTVDISTVQLYSRTTAGPGVLMSYRTIFGQRLVEMLQDPDVVDVVTARKEPHVTFSFRFKEDRVIEDFGMTMLVKGGSVECDSKNNFAITEALFNIFVKPCPLFPGGGDIVSGCEISYKYGLPAIIDAYVKDEDGNQKSCSKTKVVSCENGALTLADFKLTAYGLPEFQSGGRIRYGYVVAGLAILLTATYFRVRFRNGQ